MGTKRRKRSRSAAKPPAFVPQLSTRLRATLRYRRFVAPPYTIALLDGRYHLHGECGRALERLGHRVLRVPVDKDDCAATVRALLYACVEQRVDMLLAVNQIGFDQAGHIGALLEQIALPVAAWFVDSPHFVLRGAPLPAADILTVFVWERAFVASLRALGVDDVHYLPLATDSDVFRPRGHGRARSLCFVGDSMKRACSKWQSRLGHGARRAARAVSDALAGDRRRDPFSVIENARGGDDEISCKRAERRACDIVAAGTWRATRDYRGALLRALDQRELVVFGDDGWRDQLDAATLCGPVDYGAPLSALYESSAVNINATSLQMQSAVNQRVFDVPAAGAFLLSDAQSDLFELFEPAREVVTYNDADELRELAARYLRDERERRDIVERARARVLAQHRYEHRLERLLAIVSARHARGHVNTNFEPRGVSSCR